MSQLEYHLPPLAEQLTNFPKLTNHPPPPEVGAVERWDSMSTAELEDALFKYLNCVFGPKVPNNLQFEIESAVINIGKVRLPHFQQPKNGPRVAK